MILGLFSIGFSLGAVALLILGDILKQGFKKNYAELILLLSLASIQLCNALFLIEHYNLFQSRLYIILLYSVAPSFYFYSRQVLQLNITYQTNDITHALALLCALILPYHAALFTAFLIGSGYLIWLAKVIYDLREQRQRFRLELLALAVLFSIALVVLLLGFILPLISEYYFIIIYSLLIASALFAVLLTLLYFPSITTDVSEAVHAAYQISTLKNINKAEILNKLQHLMTQDKLYRMENLSLEILAEQLNLSSHQLSELINTEYKQSFSRYIREYRINEAKELLLNQSKSSVLSIGLSVGFNSQSNFYAAFKDSVGIPPAQYRKEYKKTC